MMSVDERRKIPIKLKPLEAQFIRDSVSFVVTPNAEISAQPNEVQTATVF